MIDIETMSILIVDDMKSMRSIIKKTLRHLGIGREIHFAENGQAGLQCLKEKKVDLAIVDWKMPMMTGAQLLDAIRNDRVLRDLPVLMVTAESERDIVYEVAEIEVDAYLIKPLSPAILEEKITAVIQKVNAPDDATVFTKRARNLEESGDIDRAIQYQEKAVALKPHASRLKRNLGVFYGKQGKTAKMEKCLLDAAACNSQDAVTRHLLGTFYWQKKDWNRSVQYECEVLNLTNRYNDHAFELGKTLLSMKQNDLAIRLLSKLVNKMKKRLNVKEKIFDLCVEHGEMRFARALVLRLVEEFPTHHGLLFKAGLVFEALKDDDLALEYFLAADQNMVEPVASKLKIARLYLKRDKVLQADDFITQVLRIDPDNEAALEIRRSI